MILFKNIFLEKLLRNSDLNELKNKRYLYSTRLQGILNTSSRRNCTEHCTSHALYKITVAINLVKCIDCDIQ